jgi:hypothetical protein
MAAALTLPTDSAPLPAEQRIVLYGVSWKDYVILRDVLDGPTPRMTYLEGTLGDEELCGAVPKRVLSEARLRDRGPVRRARGHAGGAAGVRGRGLPAVALPSPAARAPLFSLRARAALLALSLGSQPETVTTLPAAAGAAVGDDVAAVVAASAFALAAFFFADAADLAMTFGAAKKRASPG